jgi:soluble lytic murein transglycosylase-like protein
MTQNIASPYHALPLVGFSVRALHASLLVVGFVMTLLTAASFLAGGPPAGVTRLIEYVLSFKDASRAESTPQLAAETPSSLPGNLQTVADAIARRYRVAQPAVADIVRLADISAREARLDTLLVLAVIGVESRFNPYSESTFGAQGLMQVIGRFHTDKYQPTANGLALLDPETNIRVGAQILREYLNRTGDLNDALRLYGGETENSGIGYADKVRAERERLKQAGLRGKS